MVKSLVVETPGPGLTEITQQVRDIVRHSHARTGLCTVFIRHTSASLLIQENADPSVRRDLHDWMARAAPAGDPRYTHNDEGPDDMPSHIRSAITNVSISIPIDGGELVLGRWQGVYVWEHRAAPHRREIVVHVGA